MARHAPHGLQHGGVPHVARADLSLDHPLAYRLEVVLPAGRRIGARHDYAQRKPGQYERSKTIYNHWHAALRPGMAAIAAFGFGYIAFLYLTLPDVRELRTKNFESTAFMDLRAREARAEGRKPRRVHQWVPYNRISPHLKRAVLVAEDAGFWGHEGIDLVEIKKALETDWERGTPDARREHDYAAACEEPVSVTDAESVSKAERTAHHPSSRARAEQDPHLRVVSQQHRVGRRHLGSRGGGAHVLWNVRRPRSGPIRRRSWLVRSSIRAY